MRLIAVLAGVAIIGLLIWMALFPRANVSDATRPAETIDPLSAATATDPYLRSIQGAQEARTRMERRDIEAQLEF